MGASAARLTAPGQEPKELAGEEKQIEASPHSPWLMLLSWGLLERQRAYYKGRAIYALTLSPWSLAWPPHLLAVAQSPSR